MPSDDGPKCNLGCLFCLRHNGGFRSREHILPEGIAGDGFVLEPGWVCDECNSGCLAPVDQQLLDMPNIALARVILGKRLKGSRAPKAVGENFALTYDDDKGAAVFSPKPGGTLRYRTSDDGSQVTLQLRQPWGATDAQRAAFCRALWKIGVEGTLYFRGEQAYQTPLDPVRQIVRTGAKEEGWFGYVRSDARPRDVLDISVRGVRVQGLPCLTLTLNIFGNVFFTELLHRLPRTAEGFRRELGLPPSDLIDVYVG